MRAPERRPADAGRSSAPRRPPTPRRSPPARPRRRAAAADPGSSWPAASCPTRADRSGAGRGRPPARSRGPAVASDWPRTSARSGTRIAPADGPSGPAATSLAPRPPVVVELDPRRRRPATRASAPIGPARPRRRASRPARTSTPSTRRGLDRGRPGDDDAAHAAPGQRRRPSAGRPAPAGPRRRATARRSGRRGRGPAGPAPTRAGCRPPSPGPARRRPCAGRPGRG